MGSGTKSKLGRNARNIKTPKTMLMMPVVFSPCDVFMIFLPLLRRIISVKKTSVRAVHLSSVIGAGIYIYWFAKALDIRKVTVPILDCFRNLTKII
jgi:hypothetical protein